MSALRVYAQEQSVGRSAEGAWVALRATRDGSPIVVPWYQALGLEGRVFQAASAVGADATLTLVTVAALADTVATIAADIPDGTACIPFEADFTFRATGAAIDIYQLFMAQAVNGVAGTETAITPRNLRGDNNIATAATAMHTASGEADNVDGTEIVLQLFSTSQDLDATGIDPERHWSVVKAGFAPVLWDACSFNLIAAATTSGTGQGFLTWCELPESAFN